MEPDSTEARLSVQRALLGKLTPNLFGACVALEGRVIVLTWYVAPALTRDELADLQVAGTEVVADFPDFDIRERFIEVTDSAATLPTIGNWVVLQRGFRVSSDS